MEMGKIQKGPVPVETHQDRTQLGLQVAKLKKGEWFTLTYDETVSAAEAACVRCYIRWWVKYHGEETAIVVKIRDRQLVIYRKT